MKLLYCDYCKDIIRLYESGATFCRCGKSWGKYLSDGNHAEIHGEYAVPIGINSYSLQSVVSMYLFGKMPTHTTTTDEVGWLFDSFVYNPLNDMVVKKD